MTKTVARVLKPNIKTVWDFNAYTKPQLWILQLLVINIHAPIKYHSIFFRVWVTLGLQQVGWFCFNVMCFTTCESSQNHPSCSAPYDLSCWCDDSGFIKSIFVHGPEQVIKFKLYLLASRKSHNYLLWLDDSCALFLMKGDSAAGLLTIGDSAATGWLTVTDSAATGWPMIGDSATGWLRLLSASEALVLAELSAVTESEMCQQILFSNKICP